MPGLPLLARRARIDTYQQPVVYMRSDCAAGAERVVIDIPAGPTAKVRSQAAAHSLGAPA